MNKAAETVKKLHEVWHRERINQGVTQAQVAESMGMQQPAFSQYINGVIPLNLSFIIQLCDFLECDPTEIQPDITSALNLRGQGTLPQLFSDAECTAATTLYALEHPVLKQNAVLLDQRAEWLDVLGNINALPKGAVLIGCKPNMYKVRFPDSKGPPREGIYCVRTTGQRGFRLLNEDQYTDIPESDIDLVYLVIETSFKLLK